MKNVNLFLVVLLFNLLICPLFAQKDSLATEKLPQIPTGCIAINGGLTFATEDFGNPDIGGAISGNTFQLTFGIPFVSSYFGVAGKSAYSTFSMTNQPFFTQQLEIYKKEGMNTELTFNENSNQQIQQLSFLTGAYGTLPFGRFSIDARILIGPTRMVRPAISIDITDQNNNVTTYTQGVNVATTFLYDFGIGFRVNLLKSEKLCFMVNFDYSKSTSNFNISSDGMYVDEIGKTRIGNHTEKNNYAIGFYDLTAGIGYVW